MNCSIAMGNYIGNMTKPVYFIFIGRSMTSQIKSEMSSLKQSNMTSRKTTAMTSESEFSSRLARVKAVCKQKSVENVTSSTSARHLQVFPFAEQGGLYCYVPKAGCTFWKRVYMWMHRKVCGESIFQA